VQKIVLIGGGSGVSLLLAELNKKRGVEVFAVVTVFDDGGSTGLLRKKFGIPAVGDFRKCVSVTAGEIGKFFEQRKGMHALGNLALVDLIREKGFRRATEIFSKFGAAEVSPVSFSVSEIIGILESGEEIRGEEKFDYPPRSLARKKVKKISLRPKAILNSRVKKILAAADKIVVDPGSLFGSLLVNFEVAGFREAFQKSSAKKILVMNCTREFGCRGEGEDEIVKRFGVEFDKVLLPSKNLKRWSGKLLAERVSRI